MPREDTVLYVDVGEAPDSEVDVEETTAKVGVD